MNQWHIYEMLKQNKIPSTGDIAEIEKMNADEVKEGLIEWFTVLSRDSYYQNSRAKKVLNYKS